MLGDLKQKYVIILISISVLVRNYRFFFFNEGKTKFDKVLFELQLSNNYNVPSIVWSHFSLDHVEGRWLDFVKPKFTNFIDKGLENYFAHIFLAPVIFYARHCWEMTTFFHLKFVLCCCEGGAIALLSIIFYMWLSRAMNKVKKNKGKWILIF